MRYMMDKEGRTNPSQEVHDLAMRVLFGGLVAKKEYSREVWKEVKKYLKDIRDTADRVQKQI